MITRLTQLTELRLATKEVRTCANPSTEGVTRANVVQASGSGWDQPYSAIPGNEAPTVQAYNVDDEVDWDDDEPPMPGGSALMSQQTGSQEQTRVDYYRPPQFVRNPKQVINPPRDQGSWKKDSGPWGNDAPPPRAQPNQGQGGGYRWSNGHFPNSGDHQSCVVLQSASGRYHPAKLQAQDGKFARLDLTKNADIPSTVYDLREYDAYITALHKSLPPNGRFMHGNGKVRPGCYGSTPALDLGLCFVTFKTRSRCELGVACAWRHHPLTHAERDWIVANGHAQFLEDAKRLWSVPEIPVPGANLHGK
jgi:hypothetical protein